MPSLNLRTKKIRYAKSDERAIEAAIVLLRTMIEYDAAVVEDAGDAEDKLCGLLAHVRRTRGATVP